MIILRLLLLFLFLAGAGIGVGYPALTAQIAANQTEQRRVLDTGSGVRAATSTLSGADGPLRLWLEVSMPAPHQPPANGTAAVVKVLSAGRTLFTFPVSFANAELRDDNPQTPERAFRVEVGTVQALEPGTYQFVVEKAGTAMDQVTSMDIIVQRRSAALDPRLQPAGFALMAVGFVGLMLTFARRGGGGEGGSETRRSRWGRNASS